MKGTIKKVGSNHFVFYVIGEHGRIIEIIENSLDFVKEVIFTRYKDLAHLLEGWENE